MATTQEELEQIDNELKKRGVPVSSASVLAPEGTTLEEFQKAGKSLLKGSAKGLVDIVGGWGNLYDYLKQSKDPSALSSQGILRGITALTGVDPMKIEGYPGMYEIGQAAGPAVALTAINPAMGLFSPTGSLQRATGTAGRLASEGIVAAGMGLTAQSIAPDSIWTQLGIQMIPGVGKSAAERVQAALVRPTGTVSPEVAALQQVGRMTPGEATGSRVQLATESRVEKAPSIEAKATTFRKEQALDAETFLTSLFDRSASKAITDPQEATARLSGAFLNYGKTLANKLRTDAGKDFSAAEKSGGIVDSQPIVAKVLQFKSNLSPLSPSDMALAPKLDTIINELFIPAKPEVVTPSLILGAEGTPAFTNVQAATQAGTKGIPIPELKKALSDWGKAAYSGEYTLNGSNVFEGVAPGQAKGIARAILNGYKEALDVAIDQGIPGADKLKTARDNFSNNLKQIDEFAERPIVKAFGKPVNQLVPEVDVIPVLQNMPQTQRKLLFQIMGEQAPEVADTIRLLQFNEVLKRAQDAAGAASAADPAFSIKTALSQMNSKTGDFSFLFPNPADAAQASKAMQWMQKVLQSESPSTLGATGGDAYSITRGVGGGSQAANIAKEIAVAVRNMIANPNAFANVIFDKDAVNAIIAVQNKTTPQKMLDTLSNIGRASAKSAVKAGPRMATDQPVMEGQDNQAVPSSEPTLEEINQILKSRGIE
jgi:hypothetical protein